MLIFCVIGKLPQSNRKQNLDCAGKGINEEKKTAHAILGAHLSTSFPEFHLYWKRPGSEAVYLFVSYQS